MSDGQPHADAAPLFLFADLLYPTSTAYRPVELAAAVRDRLPRVELVSAADQASPVVFAHPDLATRIQDSSVPVPMLTLVSDVGKPVDPNRLAPLLQHTYA